MAPPESAPRLVADEGAHAEDNWHQVEKHRQAWSYWKGVTILVTIIAAATLHLAFDVAPQACSALCEQPQHLPAQHIISTAQQQQDSCPQQWDRPLHLDPVQQSHTTTLSSHAAVAAAFQQGFPTLVPLFRRLCRVPGPLEWNPKHDSRTPHQQPAGCELPDAAAMGSYHSSAETPRVETEPWDQSFPLAGSVMQGAINALRRMVNGILLLPTYALVRRVQTLGHMPLPQ